MTPVLVTLGIAAFLVLWWLGMSRAAGGRFSSPLWLGFGATAGALLFLWAGLAGYKLSKHERSISGIAWSDGVIWWEVWVGLGLTVFASVMLTRGWRRTIRLTHH